MAPDREKVGVREKSSQTTATATARTQASSGHPQCRQLTGMTTASLLSREQRVVQVRLSTSDSGLVQPAHVVRKIKPQSMMIFQPAHVVRKIKPQSMMIVQPTFVVRMIKLQSMMIVQPPPCCREDQTTEQDDCPTCPCGGEDQTTKPNDRPKMSRSPGKKTRCVADGRHSVDSQTLRLQARDGEDGHIHHQNQTDCSEACAKKKSIAQRHLEMIEH